MFTGMGTVINVVAILLGSCLGVLLGHRLPARTRTVVTDGLGLMTILVAGFAMAELASDELADAVGRYGFLIILGSILLGGLVGSAIGIEDRLDRFGQWAQDRLSGSGTTFAEGFVTASLVFCIGPLGVLGSLSDGLGNGIDQLALKSVMDGFASIAFAASLGWGVALSALSIAVYQGSLTLLAVFVGNILPPGSVPAMTATGGLLLLGVAFRLLKMKDVAVADLLPALVVAPVLVAAISALRG